MWVIVEVLNKFIEILSQASSDEEDAAQSFDVIVSRAGKRRESEEEQPERPRKTSSHLPILTNVSLLYPLDFLSSVYVVVKTCFNECFCTI